MAVLGNNGVKKDLIKQYSNKISPPSRICAEVVMIFHHEDICCDGEIAIRKTEKKSMGTAFWMPDAPFRERK
jgi:hypothetical protein